MEKNLEFVVFKLNNEHYAISIKNVENIEKSLDITRVPFTEDYIVGVMNLRGNIIPVIDLRKRFCLPDKEDDDETRIIIVNSGEFNIGVKVDESEEVIRLSDEDIDLAPVLRDDVQESFIKQVGKSDNRIIMLVDVQKLLDLSSSDFE